MTPSDPAFEDAAFALLVVDGEGAVQRGNAAASRLSGRPLTEILGTTLDRAFPTTPTSRPVSDLLTEVSGRVEPVEREVALIALDGDVKMVKWTAAPTSGGVVLSGADITSHHRLTSALAHQALHDPLTGLPNRVLLLEHLELALRRRRRHAGELAVLFLDLDHFKDVNDTYGHEAGDQLLVALAERLRRVLRPSDTVARLAGDEFVAVCEDVGGGAEVTEIARRLRATVERPFRLGDVEATVSMSVGTAMAAPTDSDADALLREADKAMYGVKGRRRHRRRGRRPVPAGTGVREVDLRRALEQGDLTLAYQPEVNLGDGRLVALEALARWRDPGIEAVTPTAVLAMAEALGLVVEVGRQVVAMACSQAAQWAASAGAAGRAAPVVSINLSLVEIGEPALAEAAAVALHEAGTDPSLLRVEVTEHDLVREPAAVLAGLGRWSEIGVRTAIDDVGRAVASIDALGGLHVDAVKLDRPWVWSSARPWGPGQGVAAAVAGLARRLGARAVAEGVESEEELTAVRGFGYEAASGHWFAQPQPAAVVSQMVEVDLRWPTSARP